MSNSLDPGQARHFVGPELGSKTVFKSYQQIDTSISMIGMDPYTGFVMAQLRLIRS